MLRSHYQGSLFGALLPLLNPFALLAGVISLAMLTVHGGVWLQLRADDPVASRSRSAGHEAFALRRRRLRARRRSGYGSALTAIASSANRRTAPCPIRWTSRSSATAHAWFDIYGRMPVAMIAPALGLAAPLLTALLAMGAPPRPRLRDQRAGHGGNHRLSRAVDVSLRHAVEPRSALEPDDLGRLVEPSDADA